MFFAYISSKTAPGEDELMFFTGLSSKTASNEDGTQLSPAVLPAGPFVQNHQRTQPRFGATAGQVNSADARPKPPPADPTPVLQHPVAPSLRR